MRLIVQYIPSFYDRMSLAKLRVRLQFSPVMRVVLGQTRFVCEIFHNIC